MQQNTGNTVHFHALYFEWGKGAPGIRAAWKHSTELQVGKDGEGHVKTRVGRAYGTVRGGRSGDKY